MPNQRFEYANFRKKLGFFQIGDVGLFYFISVFSYYLNYLINLIKIEKC